MNKHHNLTLRVITLISVISLLSACAGMSRNHKTTSIIDYLYADKNQPLVSESIPHLSLPLNVGIAFVPDSTYASPLTEQNKYELLSRVGKRFEQQTFVNHVAIIPSAYLNHQGGFTNLEQIKTMYNIDVIALISYDQKQFTDEGIWSVAYWTIIGAYIIPGEKNDTHTMLDAVLYDIASQQLLFRAPGTSHIKGNSTPINLSEELREDSLEGFFHASSVLMTNLETELSRFKERVKNKPEQYKVSYKPNYSGAGSFGVMAIFFASLTLMRFKGSQS